MLRRIPTVPERMAIALYGALLVIILLGMTALNMRPRTPTPPAQAALGAAVTRPASATPAASATDAATASATRTPNGTVTASATFTRTATRTATETATPTATATNTSTPSPTFTATLTPTATDTPTPLPTPGPGAGNRKVCVPILMYHHIGYAAVSADDIERGLTTAPEIFEQQLKLFQAEGVAVIGFDDLLYALALGRPLPEKRVIITIDDGYSDVYKYGFPLLQKYGYHATLFIPTGFIDRGQYGYMTWPQIEEMAQAGNDIEPHTIDHVDLRRRTRDYLIYQILGSKQTVEAHTGREARYFAYPSGEFDDFAIEMLQEMNFWAAVSTDKPTANSAVLHSLDSIYTLKRLRVSNSIDVESMKVYLRFCGFDVK
jgi:peptidoglycan/xylan/chitin deacetylase (PgdA/CDA1 family)